MSEDYKTVDYSKLDPGIRDVVRVLRKAWFQTTDSGDGVSKPPEERTVEGPHVFITVPPKMLLSESHRLMNLLGSGWRVEATYSPADGVALLAAYMDEDFEGGEARIGEGEA